MPPCWSLTEKMKCSCSWSGPMSSTGGMKATFRWLMASWRKIKEEEVEGQNENDSCSSSSSVGFSGDLGKCLQDGHCGVSFHGSSTVRQEQTSSVHQSGDTVWLVHLAQLALVAPPTLH